MESGLAAAVFLLMAGLLHGVTGFPSGAPSSTCSSMLPVHGSFAAQSSLPPYQIATSSTTYSPGHSISGKHILSYAVLSMRCLNVECCIYAVTLGRAYDGRGHDEHVTQVAFEFE